MNQELDMLRKRMLRDLTHASKTIIDLNKIVTRLEGETWKEDGKEWIFENGFVKKLTDIGTVAKNTTIPNFCPKCSKKMITNVDIEMYKTFGHCLECQTKFETSLKINGTYEQYMNQIHNDEIDYRMAQLVKEMEEYFEASVDKKVMDVNFQTDLIKNDISDDIVRRNVKEKLDYLEKLKII
jgi:hypothetical protein